MVKTIIRYFDRLEDRTRTALSRRPIIYTFIGGVGIVLFWRGIWMVADESGLGSIASIVIGFLILVSTGLFVAFFIGDEIIISGLKQEKKVAERTAEEVRAELDTLYSLARRFDAVESELKRILQKLGG